MPGGRFAKTQHFGCFKLGQQPMVLANGAAYGVLAQQAFAVTTR
jgi:hypothetical protein